MISCRKVCLAFEGFINKIASILVIPVIHFIFSWLIHNHRINNTQSVCVCVCIYSLLSILVSGLLLSIFPLNFDGTKPEYIDIFWFEGCLWQMGFGVTQKLNLSAEIKYKMYQSHFKIKFHFVSFQIDRPISIFILFRIHISFYWENKSKDDTHCNAVTHKTSKRFSFQLQKSLLACFFLFAHKPSINKFYFIKNFLNLHAIAFYIFLFRKYLHKIEVIKTKELSALQQ